MLQCLLLEGEEGTDSEEREDSSIEDSKEIVTLAFVRENTGTQNGLQNAQQQGKKKRKKKRLGLKDEEWGSMLPFIIDGFKFDLRIYVLMTSCDPLRIFVYDEGLARFATTSYSHPCPDNLDDICMHLTNYSINKHSSNFLRDAHSGSKRKLSTFNVYMESHGYNVGQIWRDIEDIIIKTLISAHPIIKHNYHTCFPNHTLNSACFEILGFDILLDHKLKPWLLEVNHSPSFSTDSWLDKEVKDSLLYDTLVLINLRSCDKKKVLEEERQRARFLQQCRSRETRKEEVKGFQAMLLEKTDKYEKENCGGFRLIYPSVNSEKYEKFFQDNNSLFQNTVASRAREVYARSITDLRNSSLLSYSRPELSKPVSRIREAKSTSAVNTVTSTV
ncbi:Tubulin polyglutamylase TTLL6, partial [Eschrichtius robustus]|nr:Tubulin polyglutamylase TTLL6 [Eschrichtius robustus]